VKDGPPWRAAGKTAPKGSSFSGAVPPRLSFAFGKSLCYPDGEATPPRSSRRRTKTSATSLRRSAAASSGHHGPARPSRRADAGLGKPLGSWVRCRGPGCSRSRAPGYEQVGRAICGPQLKAPGSLVMWGTALRCFEFRRQRAFSPFVNDQKTGSAIAKAALGAIGNRPKRAGSSGLRCRGEPSKSTARPIAAHKSEPRVRLDWEAGAISTTTRFVDLADGAMRPTSRKPFPAQLLVVPNRETWLMPRADRNTRRVPSRPFRCRNNSSVPLALRRRGLPQIERRETRWRAASCVSDRPPSCGRKTLTDRGRIARGPVPVIPVAGQAEPASSLSSGRRAKLHRISCVPSGTDAFDPIFTRHPVFVDKAQSMSRPSLDCSPLIK